MCSTSQPLCLNRTRIDTASFEKYWPRCSSNTVRVMHMYRIFVTMCRVVCDTNCVLPSLNACTLVCKECPCPHASFSVPRRAHGIDSILPSSHSVCFQRLQDCCNFTASGVKMSHASRRVCDHVTNFNAYCPYTCKGGDHLVVTQIATQLPCLPNRIASHLSYFLLQGLSIEELLQWAS